MIRLHINLLNYNCTVDNTTQNTIHLAPEEKYKYANYVVQANSIRVGSKTMAYLNSMSTTLSQEKV